MAARIGHRMKPATKAALRARATSRWRVGMGFLVGFMGVTVPASPASPTICRAPLTTPETVNTPPTLGCEAGGVLEGRLAALLLSPQ